ncbi:NYN domain-containing protein [Microvirga massiliensis]|uniref:LabA-like NYN domain-containing protein n=1 Tax=Microvirga massiliensis TaxID=1033741 RepID=UPI00062BBE6B|nr:NYN domain-containing protein [Microvirga massiliensis]
MFPRERVALLIDGPNFHNSFKALNITIDYSKLLEYFSQNATLVRAYYYTALREDNEYNSLRPLIDWLDYNGYKVVTKPTKEFVDPEGIRRVKGNMDIEIAVDALEITPFVDRIYLFSGDGDFRSLVEVVQRRGKQVTVVSTLASRPPMLADELRRQADAFIDVARIADSIKKDRDPTVPQVVRAA